MDGLRSLVAEGRRPWRLLVVSVGAIGFQLAYFYAVADVGVAVATLVTLGLAPVAAVLYESVEARRPPPLRTVAVLVCALAGLALVSLSRTTAAVAPQPTRGVLLSVVSGLLYAGSTMASRRLSGRLSPQALTAGTTVIGVVLLLPAALVAGPGIPFTAPVIGGVAYLGIVTSAVAYVLFYLGLRTTPGGVAMVLTLLEPATAVVLAALLLHEPIGLASGTGALLVLTAVAVLYLFPPPASAPVVPSAPAP
jgi:DME family drug/metabolite transporter